jgi:hypothetical protein
MKLTETLSATAAAPTSRSPQKLQRIRLRTTMPPPSHLSRRTFFSSNRRTGSADFRPFLQMLHPKVSLITRDRTRQLSGSIFAGAIVAGRHDQMSLRHSA